ncbi:MAG: hypothetical protein R3A12_13875 [Ignavibacteria bacterium]
MFKNVIPTTENMVMKFWRFWNQKLKMSDYILYGFLKQKKIMLNTEANNCPE